MQRYLSISSVLLLILCLILSVRIYFKVTVLGEKKQKETAKELEYYYLKDQFNFWLESENQNMIERDVFYGNDSSTLVPISSLLTTPKLIYRVSGNMCSDCIEFGRKQLENVFGEINEKSNVMIVLSDVSSLEKKTIYKNRCFSLYESNVTLSYLPVETYCIPFFFVVDENMKIKMLFTPDKALPQYTEQYLLAVARYLKNNAL